MMQVLGQYVEIGDVITFPVNRQKGRHVEAQVARLVGLNAFDAQGNARHLPYDDHVTVITTPPRRRS